MYPQLPNMAENVLVCFFVSSELLEMITYNLFFAFFVSPCRLVTESSGCTIHTCLAFL